MKITDKLKKIYQKFLETLIKDNKKSFGDGPLNCCDLNKKK